MFTITRHKGFMLTFSNRVTISVQWGSGNYCENKDRRQSAELSDEYSSKDAEIAIWIEDEPERIWCDILGDPCRGWLTPDVVGEIIGCLSTIESPTRHGVAIRINRILRSHQTQPRR